MSASTQASASARMISTASAGSGTREFLSRQRNLRTGHAGARGGEEVVARRRRLEAAVAVHAVDRREDRLEAASLPRADLGEVADVAEDGEQLRRQRREPLLAAVLAERREERAILLVRGGLERALSMAKRSLGASHTVRHAVIEVVRHERAARLA